MVVFVQLFVQGFIFGIIFVTDGDIQLVGPGLLSFPLVEGDFRSFALFAQVFPDKAVKHGPAVQDVDADFAHDAFYHPAGGEVIGFVYVARNVGILCQQLLGDEETIRKYKRAKADPIIAPDKGQILWEVSVEGPSMAPFVGRKYQHDEVFCYISTPWGEYEKIFANFTGRIVEVCAQQGAVVNKGDVIAYLERTEFTA